MSGYIEIDDMPDLGAVTDTTDIVGEKAGSGLFSATALRDYVLAAMPTPTPPRGGINGLTLLYSTGTSLAVTAGACVDSTNTTIITLPAMSKTTSGPWTPGNGTSGMGNGLTVVINGWYHVFAIVVGGVADMYFDTSPSAANKPVGTTAWRRIGSFATTSPATIVPFDQYGDRVDWRAPVPVYSGLVGVTTAVTTGISGVPNGFAAEAMLTVALSDPSTTAQIYISSLAQTDQPAAAPNITAQIGPAIALAVPVRVMTNPAQSFRIRVAAVTTSIVIACNGYIDTRGRGE
jgi:hypothetical protein